MSKNADAKVFGDLERIINKHFLAMQDEIMAAKNEAMVAVFPSTLLQSLVSELFKTSNPVVVTATILAILTQQVALEASKIVDGTLH